MMQQKIIHFVKFGIFNHDSQIAKGIFDGGGGGYRIFIEENTPLWKREKSKITMNDDRK